MKIYFSDFFDVQTEQIENYGALNISLINDLPLFIDPFLLFGSTKIEYKKLHENVKEYLIFLRTKAVTENKKYDIIKSWYLFPEVKQNWLGYSQVGNSGSGLGEKFGRSFSSSIGLVFDDLGKEKITETTHLEKAGLFQIGVGRDNISDFTTNLIKEYLLEYTQTFAVKYINAKYLKEFTVSKVYFDYTLERWMPKKYTLPLFKDDYVLLTPKDILTKDDIWINSNDLRGNFHDICSAIPNNQLRSDINNYYHKILPIPKRNKENSQKEITATIIETIKKFPDIIKFYIKSKEENKAAAKEISQYRVDEVQQVFIENIRNLVSILEIDTDFYNYQPESSYTESMKRVNYLKDVIEDNDGYKLFYINGKPIKHEQDLQVIYRLTWYATNYDVNREANNGRGSVDYSISKGASDKTLIEFKLASNSKLKQNLAKQVEVYEKANKTKNSIKVILFFTKDEYLKIKMILRELSMEKHPNIVLISAEKKVSASNVKQ